MDAPIPPRRSLLYVSEDREAMLSKAGERGADGLSLDLEDAVSTTLSELSCDYAFYYRRRGEEQLFLRNCDLFVSASIIKVPILFAWVYLERTGEVERSEMCDLDLEPQVREAGLSWLLESRRLPFADVLLLMIALSDNLCTNLVIRRIGIERLNAIFRGALGLRDTRLERKLLDYEARAAGRDNWISPLDCVHFYRLRDGLSAAERAWVESMLLANDDLGLWLRNIPRDTAQFYHKTGSMEGVLHDWGYTRDVDLFLLTQQVADERNVYRIFDKLGPLLLG